MLVIPMLVLVWAAILLWDSRRVNNGCHGAFAGAMLVTVQKLHGVTHYLSAWSTRRSRGRQALLPGTGGRRVRRDASSGFELANLPHWPDKTAVRLYRGVVSAGRVPNFWIPPGDAQLLLPHL